MVSEGSKRSRRSILKYALGTLGMLAAPVADIPELLTQGEKAYRVVDRRELLGGGVGLFVVVAPDLSRDGLRAVGDQLREELRAQPNAVVEVFDDVDAAKTVRAGSRVVGEERFEAALQHQKASYQKNAKSGRDVFLISQQPAEIIRY